MLTCNTEREWARLSYFMFLQGEMRFCNISHTVIVYGVEAAIKDLLSSHYWVGGRRYRICKLHFESNKATSHGVFVHQSNRFIRTNPLLPTNCILCFVKEIIIKLGSFNHVFFNLIIVIKSMGQFEEHNVQLIRNDFNRHKFLEI